MTTAIVIGANKQQTKNNYAAPVYIDVTMQPCDTETLNTRSFSRKFINKRNQMAKRKRRDEIQTRKNEIRHTQKSLHFSSVCLQRNYVNEIQVEKVGYNVSLIFCVFMLLLLLRLVAKHSIQLWTIFMVYLYISSSLI